MSESIHAEKLLSNGFVKIHDTYAGPVRMGFARLEFGDEVKHTVAIDDMGGYWVAQSHDVPIPAGFEDKETEITDVAAQRIGLT